MDEYQRRIQSQGCSSGTSDVTFKPIRERVISTKIQTSKERKHKQKGTRTCYHSRKSGHSKRDCRYYKAMKERTRASMNRSIKSNSGTDWKIRSNNEQKYVESKQQDFLRQKGVKHQLVVAYTLLQKDE